MFLNNRLVWFAGGEAPKGPEGEDVIKPSVDAQKAREQMIAERRAQMRALADEMGKSMANAFTEGTKDVQEKSAWNQDIDTASADFSEDNSLSEHAKAIEAAGQIDDNKEEDNRIARGYKDNPYGET
jgi:hypothetical protein